MTRRSAARRLAARVLPYTATFDDEAPAFQVAWWLTVVAPMARTIDRVVGAEVSVRRRLERSGSNDDVLDFRIEQALWGLGFSAAAAVLGAVRTVGNLSAAPLWAGIAAFAFVVGALMRDQRLSAAVKARERLIVAEFPVVAELLALAVTAGEGPVSALDRVVARCHGAMSAELARVLAAIRAGVQVSTAFDQLAARIGVPAVARFASGFAVAVERGTPLADVLHAQAADVREAGRRHLIETAARKEVLMMMPIVFAILPTIVAIALFPGIAGLRLS